MDIIVNELQKFNFSKIEANVYVILLKNGQLNGSQVAKLVGAARASVYSALETLYSKGAVFLIPGISKEYRAKRPKILLKELRSEMDKSLDYLENQLKDFGEIEDEELFWNIRGIDNYYSTIKGMFQTAVDELFINTNYNLREFEKEIVEANNRGVKITLFTFEDLNLNDLPIKIFYNSKLKECFHIGTSGKKRFMMIKDYKECFIANENGKNGERIGTFTKNSLLVSIVYEHIHHDIYLFKIEEDYGLEWWRKLKLKSLGEKLSFDENKVGLKK